jgi:hypothetical protein
MNQLRRHLFIRRKEIIKKNHARADEPVERHLRALSYQKKREKNAQQAKHATPHAQKN